MAPSAVAVFVTMNVVLAETLASPASTTKSTAASVCFVGGWVFSRLLLLLLLWVALWQLY